MVFASQLLEKAAKAAAKTHKERVAEFNEKLENLSEHYDIPRVSTRFVWASVGERSDEMGADGASQRALACSTAGRTRLRTTRLARPVSLFLSSPACSAHAIHSSPQFALTRCRLIQLHRTHRQLHSHAREDSFAHVSRHLIHQVGLVGTVDRLRVRRCEPLVHIGARGDGLVHGRPLRADARREHSERGVRVEPEEEGDRVPLLAAQVDDPVQGRLEQAVCRRARKEAWSAKVSARSERGAHSLAYWSSAGMSRRR